MSEMGQKPKLPRCNINACFTSVSRTLPALPTRLGRHAATTFAPAKGLPTVHNIRPTVAEWTA
jgi:hypothetical protein